MQIKVHADVPTNTVKITQGEDTLTLNAAEVDAVVLGLAQARSHLKPEIPAEAPRKEPAIDAIANPAYWTEFRPEHNGSLLFLRHPGYGWIPYFIPSVDRDRLVMYWQKHALKQPGAAKH
jgi:hypothetical protein